MERGSESCNYEINILHGKKFNAYGLGSGFPLLAGAAHHPDAIILMPMDGWGLWPAGEQEVARQSDEFYIILSLKIKQLFWRTWIRPGAYGTLFAVGSQIKVR